MTRDTQWPRFEVFVQEKDGAPFLDAGSVHAPDAELALLNARDVFARRPEAVAMWVVPADVIYAKTDEELRASPLRAELLPVGEAEMIPSVPELYYVFCKEKAAGTQTLIGSMKAAFPAEALEEAIADWQGKRPFAWWVVPAGAVTASRPEDTPSFYAPALDKPFRLSTDFKTVTAMRQIKE